MAERTCTVCEGDMPPGMRADAKYCGKVCQNASRGARYYVTRTCAVCGDQWEASPARDAKYCSVECRCLDKWGREPAARAVVLADPQPEYCWIPEAHPARTGISDPGDLQFVVGSCGDCGDWFTIRGRRFGSWCSDECKTRAASRRRRGRERDAEQHPYSRNEIFERDGWMCQLCMKPLHRSRSVPHPKAPTIDHIVPLAKGGADAPWNVQAAHNECNYLKSDTVSGQLRLPISKAA